MSNARVYSRAALGLDAPLVTVEVHLSNGLPSMAIVGLPESSLRQSRERVRSAILNAGLQFPARRITVNLAPASLPKSGGRYDLAIALGILAASAQIPVAALAQCEVLGELGLDGSVRAVDALLPALMAARDSGRRLLLPAADHQRACQVRGLQAWSVAGLDSLCAALRAGFGLPGQDDSDAALNSCHYRAPGSQQDAAANLALWLDLQPVRGQHSAREALLLAAAGGHNLLLLGAPGTGKTRLAQLLAALLPPLEEAAAIQVAALHELAGQPWPLQRRRPPWRAPHHGVTAAALVGGGRGNQPGEVSLAHHGVLFLDELGEFRREALDALREPLEAAQVQLSRVQQRVCFPADFQWIAASNPCPCGQLGSEGACGCSTTQLRRYLDKLSGPLLDRHDLSVEMLAPDHRLLLQTETADAAAPDLEQLRQQVADCRQRQLARQGVLNARLDTPLLLAPAFCDAEARQLLLQLASRDQLSARGVCRVLRVARTVADLAQAPTVMASHLAQVMACRQLPRVQARLRAALALPATAPVP